MTMNDSWGYQRGRRRLENPKTVVRNLITCARDGGNYLLNIGPKGGWLHPGRIGRDLDGRGQVDGPACRSHSSGRALPGEHSEFRQFHPQRQHTLHPCSLLARRNGLDRGLTNKVLSAKLYPSNAPVQFHQEDFRVQFLGLPVNSPDPLVTVIEAECDGEPNQDMLSNTEKSSPRRRGNIKQQHTAFRYSGRNSSRCCRFWRRVRLWKFSSTTRAGSKPFVVPCFPAKAKN